MGRVPCCDKANVKKGPWSSEEDAKLKAYIEKHGTGGNWIALPHKIGLKRCGKSCRLRWLNYLRPNIKHGDFSEEEDQIICNLYISIGSRWSLIAAQLPGRTDNDIKNYWNTKLKKKLLGSCRKGSSSFCPGSSPNQEPNSPHAQPLSSSALERIQLHFQLQGLRSPFSFYSHPLLWPKLHHLRDDIFQNQPSEAFAMTPVQQASTSIVVEPSNEPVVQMEAMIPDSMSRDIQGELDGSDLYGSSSLSNNSNQDSMAKGLQDEIRDLLQGNDLDCFKELDGEKESMSWWDGNDFEDKSSFNSWDSASTLQTNLMFEEYVMEYGL